MRPWLCCLIFLCGCGGNDFVAWPWPGEHSVALIWTDRSGEPQRFEFSEGGEAIHFEYPSEAGRLYARTYSRDRTLAGMPLRMCAPGLRDTGQPFPAPDQAYTTESFEGELAGFILEETPIRDFGLRSPICLEEVIDRCEGLAFEDVALPPEFRPFSVAQLEGGDFVIGGSIDQRQAALLTVRDGVSSFQTLSSTFTDVRKLRRLGDQQLAAQVEVRGEGTRLGILRQGETKVDVFATPFRKGLEGYDGRVLLCDLDGINELMPDHSTVQLPDFGGSLDHCATIGSGESGQIVAFANGDVLRLVDGSFLSTFPPELLFTRTVVDSSQYRVHLSAGRERSAVYDGTSWQLEEEFLGRENLTRFRTGSDLDASRRIVAGDALIAVSNNGGWCVAEYPLAGFVDATYLRDGLAIAVSPTNDGKENRAVLIRAVP